MARKSILGKAVETGAFITVAMELGACPAFAESPARDMAGARAIVSQGTSLREAALSQSFSQTADPDGVQSASHVVFGRAVDLVGRPIDLSRVTSPGSAPSGMPLANSALTSGFGMRLHPILGIRREHSGVDLAAPIGTPIFATSDGAVRSAGWQGGYGLSVSLDNGAGMQTRYGHMSRMNVVAGEQVKRGDVIGYVGSTGLSTGPHLHYEVRINGQSVNPLPLMHRK